MPEAELAETDTPESESAALETPASEVAEAEAVPVKPSDEEASVPDPSLEESSGEEFAEEEQSTQLAATPDETEATEAQHDGEDDEEPATEARVETASIAPFDAPPAAAEAQSEAVGESPAESEPAITQIDPNSKLAAVVSAEEAEFEARRQERRREREARETLRSILDELIAEYAADTRGIEIREIAGGYRMGTKPEMHDAVRAFVKSLKPALKLSLPALETLAVIAYKQPVTAPEVGEIRGVDSAGVLGSLMSRKLIATAGRKQVVGRPMLYKTTKEFLLRFGLKDVSELPSMEEFEKMAAQELSEEIADDSTAQTGDLFAESETATVPEAGASEEEQEVVAIAETIESETTESQSSETESKEVAESTIDSAAASIEAQAPQPNENEATGETPDAEEIEA